MSDTETLEQLEKRMAAMAENGADAAEWIAALEEGLAAGSPKVFTDWAPLAQESLAKLGDIPAGIDLLKWRADHTPANTMSPKAWLMAADVVAGSNPHMLALLSEAGFGQHLAARECVRRLRLLHGLHSGALCLHRTWGFGIVKKSDALYKRIEIQFAGRPNHMLPMKAAAESLELLGPDHILAKLHADRESVMQQVRTNPAGVVKEALASFGPLSAAALQEKLVQGGVVLEGDWKSFWDAARKELKKDPLVDLPSKRTDPIRMKDSASGYDEAWYDKLGAERDIKTILRLVTELKSSVADVSAIPPARKRVLANRLAFVILGATSRQPGTKMAGTLLAAQFKLDPADCDWPAAARSFLSGKTFIPLLHDLPVRDIAPALAFLQGIDPDAVRSLVLNHLHDLHYNALCDAIDLMIEKGSGEEIRKLFIDDCARHLATEEMLLWIFRHRDQATAWDLPQPTALAPLAVAELEKDYSGDRLKTKKLLRERLETPEVLQAVFEGMTRGRQQDFFRQLCLSTAWTGLDRQTMQAKIIKQFPHLESIVTGESSTSEAPAASYGSVTSHRSYRDRVERLEKLINVDIPENSREIAVARSYGDLSENFEYKAAKDMQAVLLARRADLESQIAKVRPTDFSEAPQGVAGVGSTIHVAWPDGHEETYHILGEWDQVPEMHIISSNTRIAKAVAGKKPGDVFPMPSEDGTDVDCTLKDVTPLPQEILDWAK
ncbi:MAG: GreA/GreB family elongation factor [Kiritimatiellae bacterium]|nr:GreA/GreB family elongation factor [Kiritimatiellia bacterium]